MLSGNRNPRIDFLLIIQARLTSTRFPGKILQLVNGRTILKRVWDAAKGSFADKVIVAWPERYPDLDENDVRERFRRISREFPSQHIIRVTSDCPLITSAVINEAIMEYNKLRKEDHGLQYYCNRVKYPDGFDVQIFSSFLLHRNYMTHKEHVIAPQKYKTKNKWLSVDTPADLERVRFYAKYEL